ncbi:MAG: hypothetical protein NTV51_26205 [Verrucomicrobia bacterium]|nr:hypothetical protein [Verrucomicrobiota bacterium]
MPPASRDDLRRLHFIDALFAHVTGHDLYLANQIKGAIAFSLTELEVQLAEDPASAANYDAAFNAAAAELLAKLFSGLPRHGFFHWDASLTLASATPLFTRAEIMAGLKKLAPFRESTLLVTNLRPALIPPSRRATPRRQRDYEEALAFIRDLAAARTVRGTNLQLLFL